MRFRGFEYRDEMSKASLRHHHRIIIGGHVGTMHARSTAAVQTDTTRVHGTVII